MWPFGDRPGQQDPVEKYRRWLRKWLMERNHKIPGKYRDGFSIAIFFWVLESSRTSY